MQHFSIYSGTPAAADARLFASKIPFELRRELQSRVPTSVAGSHSLASMLPSLVLTGILTLFVTALWRWLATASGNDFFGSWMEAWLTTWPIAFPLAYLGKSLWQRMMRGTINLSSSLARRVPPQAPYFR